jgi:CRP/FNR family transcriptional regulator, cyclic AMP receptor protein
MTMTTVERVVALQRVALFADVPGRSLAAVAQRATEVELPAGATVIAEGAVDDHLFALVRGRLRVHQGEQTLAALDAGATVGELAALVPEPRSASVTVLEPATLLRIDKGVLDELLVDRPELARGIISALVAMVRGRARSGADSTPV